MPRKIFKEDKHNQMMLLPPDIGSFIPENHLVRVVDKVIDEIKISTLIETYKGGGATSYSPRVMLKVLVYAYIEKIYTTRMIEKALRDQITFMWLSGMIKPDHGTIHNFRAKRLKEAIEDVFGSVVSVLIERGYIKSENLFIDGTKIEANANKYSYIWGKNVERQQASIRYKVRELMSHIDKLQETEDAEYGARNLEEIEGNISSEDIARVVKEIDNKLSKGSESKEVSKVVDKIKNEYIPKLKKYKEQRDKLNGRNSCSKTDNDATFFRMKEGGPRACILRPAYNVQIATENQFILGYGIYQKAADTSVFIPFLERIKKQSHCLPENIVADAGYGSEENYEYLTNNKLGNYVKYNYFDRERKSKSFPDKYTTRQFVYNNDVDQYICPEGNPLYYKGDSESVTENGYTVSSKIYQAKDCSICQKKDACCKNVVNRTIQVSSKIRDYRKVVRENLESEKGIRLRAQRGIEVESVFGQIKHNCQFRRFYTRGLVNVGTEWGIISIAHNIKKMSN
jgi:transposase